MRGQRWDLDEAVAGYIASHQYVSYVELMNFLQPYMPVHGAWGDFVGNGNTTVKTAAKKRTPFGTDPTAALNRNFGAAGSV